MPPNPKNPQYDLPYQNRGTSTDVPLPSAQDKANSQAAALKQQKADCKAKGGTWDEGSQTCIFSPEQQLKDFKIELPKEQAQTAPQEQGKYDPERGGFVAADGRFYPTTNPDFRPGQQADQNVSFSGTGGSVTITGADGKPITLSKEEYQTYLNNTGALTNNVLAAQSAPGVAEFQGQQLAGQVGQFESADLQNPSLFDVQQGIYQGLVNFVPRAITGVGALALLGRGGAAGGAAAAGGAGRLLGGINPYVAGATVLAGLSSSIISEFQGQRRDTVTAQQRVLDEGKQTMKDWATLAETDPANKAFYLSQYNKVSSQIDQAYRQMKLDTIRDVTKFEKAVPNLAEFEAFYSAGGEKDTLDEEMRNALLAPSTAEYKMLELTNRRLPNQNI